MQAVRFRKDAFTLIEIMVSVMVLTVLLLVSAQVIGTVQRTWTSASSRVSQFREARIAFDILTRNLSQATLGTYLDYDENYVASTTSTSVGTSAGPTSYVRRSNLQFLTGEASVLVPMGGGAPASTPGHAVFFQAPLGVVYEPEYAGLDRLLCGRGYFVQFTSDEFFVPPFTKGTPKFRYRLMEYSPPAEKNMVYAYPPSTGPGGTSWYANAGIPLTNAEAETVLNRGLTRPVADNILTLIISPQVEPPAGGVGQAPTWIAPNYSYNSAAIGAIPPGAAASSQGTQHLLPPLVKVVLVALDERSATQLAERFGDQPPFGTDLSEFSVASELDQDIDKLEKNLLQFRANYRVFMATIQLRASKWSL